MNTGCSISLLERGKKRSCWISEAFALRQNNTQTHNSSKEEKNITSTRKFMHIYHSDECLRWVDRKLHSFLIHNFSLVRENLDILTLSQFITTELVIFQVTGKVCFYLFALLCLVVKHSNITKKEIILLHFRLS